MSTAAVPSMADVVRTIRDLPSLPAVVVELLSSMEQEDIDTHILANKISLDQSLTAKTLRLANSSFYGMSSKVTTIHQAISVLGFHSIRTLVTACSLTGSFSPTAIEVFDFKAFWRQSVATAVIAKLLAVRYKINPETAFTAGLLHDIGMLVLATRFPQDYAQVQAQRRADDCYIIEAEQKVFGLNHASVGSALAAHWKFPLAIQKAVEQHHDEHGPTVNLPLVVHAANTLAHALDLCGTHDDLAPPMSEAVWHALALSEQDAKTLFATGETMFNDMCTILLTP